MIYQSYGTAFGDGVRIGSFQTSKFNFGLEGINVSPRHVYPIQPWGPETFVTAAAIGGAGLLPLALAVDPSSTEVTYQGYPGVHQLDVARGVKANASANLSSAIVLTVSGWDCWGYKMVEQITLASGTGAAQEVWGKKSFGYIKSVYASAGSGSATVSLSTSWLFGLPYFIPDPTFVSVSYKRAPSYTVTVGNSNPVQFLNTPSVTSPASATTATILGGVTTTATATTGDTRGVYIPPSGNYPTEGSDWIVCTSYVPGFDAMQGTYLEPFISTTSIAQCFGVPQYSTGWQ